MAITAPGKRTYRALFGALILALVLGQSLALAHWHAHDGSDSHNCALCLYAQHVGGGVPSSPLHFPPTIPGFIAVAVSICSLIPVTSLAFLSRAPPPLLLK